MSQYRADRDAARLRIENLEARLADQDRLIERRDTELRSRDEEILRLQRQVGRVGARGVRSVTAAWASRVVGLAGTVTIIAAGAGVSVLRGVAPCSMSSHDITTYEVSSGPPLPEAEASPRPVTGPFHADPVAGGVEWSAVRDPFEAPPMPALSPGKIPIQRQLDPRVWGPSARDDAPRHPR